MSFGSVKIAALYWSVLLTDREVFKARDRKTSAIVALKKVRVENEKEGVRLSCLHSRSGYDEEMKHSSP